MSEWRWINVCSDCGYVDSGVHAGREWLRICPSCGAVPNHIRGSWPVLWEVKVARRVGFWRKRWEIRASEGG